MPFLYLKNYRMQYFIVFAGIIALLMWWLKSPKTGTQEVWNQPQEDFPLEWRMVLIRKVSFYNSLNKEEQQKFEFKVQEFLSNCRITGVQIEVDDTDRLLIASSAVIPIFNFPEWSYTNLYEVLVYPSSFDEKFRTEGPNRRILGMVGTGYMEGKMILSKQALHHGFDNSSDKMNTAVHEFVHLIDKMDDRIDGIPAALMEKQYALPWITLIEKKIEEIYANKSDVNPYGATSRIEFFAVISEYFFERPQLLAQKHPDLYELLGKIFQHDMKVRKLDRKKYEIGRNDPCPCASGIKFKKCCGSVHFNK
jgi:Mlc titration factor MtfA (ptsG expression regulator)